MLADFSVETFTHEGKTRTVYRLGEGPAVIVIAELPGITPHVVGFARRVVDIGCTAVLPHLFGEPGSDDVVGAVRSVVPACVSREFAAWATGRTSPVVGWLRALAAREHERCGGPGVGAVGMCFTGGFALGMFVEPAVVAPVMSQPSLPLGITRKARRDIQLDPGDLAAVQRRLEDDPALCVIGLRFRNDPLVPGARFHTLRELLGDRFVGVEIPGRNHSVLTRHLVDEPGHPTRDALDRVLDLFRRQLLAAAP
ncbi:MAG: dienelactone hydrolase family protein [Acidimicrobiales bacterium]